MTSADVLMHAAYGRLAKLGFDPYVVSPAEVFRMQWTRSCAGPSGPGRTR